MSKSILLDSAHLATFRAGWPCHGLPDSLHSIRFDFDDVGNLVDIEAKARNGRVLDTDPFNGSALLALSEDARNLEPETPVIFRIGRSKNDREVVAVFPCEPHDMSGRDMTCYAHVGQHGGCSFGWFHRGNHRPATPEEYADLKAELESRLFNYRLRVYKRFQPFMREAFDGELRRLASFGTR